MSTDPATQPEDPMVNDNAGTGESPSDPTDRPDHLGVELAGDRGTITVGGRDISRAVRSLTLHAAAGAFPRLQVDLLFLTASIAGSADLRVDVPEETEQALLALGWKPPRPELDGRDPDGLTPLEKLAYAYPDVHALMKEHAADEAERKKLLALCEDRIAGVQREFARIDRKRDCEHQQLRQALAAEETARQVAERVDDLLAERDRLRDRVEAALALVDDLLRPWATGRPAHPGRPAVQAGMEDVEQVQRWQAQREKLGVE